MSAASIAALGAIVALAETRRANIAAHERDREADQRERYSKAIDQLGMPGGERVDVRMGGIYALQRIAEDSDRDLPTVIDVLCAFVRGHGRGPNGESGDVLEGHRPPPDVQAALTVIGRLHSPARRSRVDLRRAHLELADLTFAELARADLRGAYLTHANLAAASMRGAFLEAASLTHVDLSGANLSHADLTHANLAGATLRGSHLNDASLPYADLSGANLVYADLSGVDLSYADLTGARLGAARGLSQEALQTARGDERTDLPGRLRPAHWPARR